MLYIIARKERVLELLELGPDCQILHEDYLTYTPYLIHDMTTKYDLLCSFQLALLL